MKLKAQMRDVLLLPGLFPVAGLKEKLLFWRKPLRCADQICWGR